MNTVFFKTLRLFFLIFFPWMIASGSGIPSSPIISGRVQSGSMGAGWYHSLGLQSNGQAVAWGYNNFGQRNVPAPNADFVFVSGGGLHSLAVTSNGLMLAWGRNLEGQTNVPAPNANFIAAAGGGLHSLGLRSDGSIVAWGLNTSGQTNVPSPNAGYLAVAAGWNHSLGLKTNGAIVAWGSNTDGQTVAPSPNTNFVSVAGGGRHSLALKNDTSIVAWGRPVEGQLAIPSPNTNFVAIAGGLVHSLALRADGTVVAWGDNTYGQTNIPLPNADFVAIAANGHHSLALRSDGTIVAWGRSGENQTNVPAPNVAFGRKTAAVAPSSGSANGGYEVVVSGYFFCGDITNVTLAGVTAASIVNQSSSQIVVVAGSTFGAIAGDVRLFTALSGELVLSNGFHYFGEQTTSGGVSIPWLVAHGITNDFEAAVLEDSDLDGVITGDEYIADTHPLDGLSYLGITALGVSATQAVLSVPVSTARVYDVEVVLSLSSEHVWVKAEGQTNLVPSSDLLVITNASPSDVRHYRMTVRKP